MLEKDLAILDKILRDLNYTPNYREILLSGLVNKLEDYGLENLSRNFIYVSLSYDEGKQKATEIADYWEQVKNTGSYKTQLQQALEKSPNFSKYLK
jgi:hypothetical protein